MPLSPSLIRIASRESRLAMVQSEWIAGRLRDMHPDCKVEIIGMTTRGDEILDKPLALIGGKGLFIKELEVALEENRADIAVHSMKDVPMTLPAGFAITIVGEREDARDALVSNRYGALQDLPASANVGTSSLRRESQLRRHFPHLTIRSLRGNVNTRLRKLDDGEYDAIILAAAGLRRLGFEGRIRSALDITQFLPAIAQGALGIEYLSSRPEVGNWLAPFARHETTAAVNAERALGRKARRLRGCFAAMAPRRCSYRCWILPPCTGKWPLIASIPRGSRTRMPLSLSVPMQCNLACR